MVCACAAADLGAGLGRSAARLLILPGFCCCRPWGWLPLRALLLLASAAVQLARLAPRGWVAVRGSRLLPGCFGPRGWAGLLLLWLALLVCRFCGWCCVAASASGGDSVVPRVASRRRLCSARCVPALLLPWQLCRGSLRRRCSAGLILPRR